MSLSLLQEFFASPTYRATFRYLLKTVYILFRWRVVAILTLAFISASAQVGAIVTIVNAITILSNNEGIDFYGLTINLPSSVGLVVAISIVPFILIAIAAYTMYISRRKTARLMIDFSSHLDAAVFLGVSKLVGRHSRNASIEEPEPSDLINMIGKDSRFAGRVVNELSSSIVPVCAVAIILPLLFYLDWQLSSILLGILICSIVVYGRVGRKGAAVSIEMEQSAPGMSREKLHTLRTIKAIGPVRSEVKMLTRRLRAQEDVIRFEQAYMDRLTMPHIGNAVGSMVLAISSFAVLVYFGSQILSGDWDQTVSATFVFLFVYSLIMIRGLGASLTNINIFYPHLRRVVQFILDTTSLKTRVIKADVRLDETIIAGPIGYVPSTRDTDLERFQAELTAAFTGFLAIDESTIKPALKNLEVVSLQLDSTAGQLATHRVLENLPTCLIHLAQSPLKIFQIPLTTYLDEAEADGFSSEKWEELDPDEQRMLTLLSKASDETSTLALPLAHISTLKIPIRKYVLDQLYERKSLIVYGAKNSNEFKRCEVEQVFNFTAEPPGIELAGKPKKVRPVLEAHNDESTSVDGLGIDEF